MKKLILFAAAVFCLTSCGAYKRLAYLQDMDPNVTYEVKQTPEARISRGDRLSIRVTSSQPLLAAPFNLSLGNISRDTTAYAGSASSLYPEYVVDSKGRINFPVLGPVFVEGLTLNELTTTLVDEIRNTNYLRDPVVFVEFTNFNILVLGEIGSPGSYNIPTGNINMFELFAKVGDLTQDAQRDRVWVIRTEGGTRKVFVVNPKSREIYDSPAFYLQQNDMVYVAPVDSKMDSKTQSVLTWITTPLALLSTIFSGWALINSYSR